MIILADVAWTQLANIGHKKCQKKSIWEEFLLPRMKCGAKKMEQNRGTWIVRKFFHWIWFESSLFLTIAPFFLEKTQRPENGNRMNTISTDKLFSGKCLLKYSEKLNVFQTHKINKIFPYSCTQTYLKTFSNLYSKTKLSVHKLLFLSTSEELLFLN